MGLTRKDIESAQDIPTEMVSVPEWGGEVRIRKMTGEDRGLWDTHIAKSSKDGQVVDQRDVYAYHCALVMVDESGNRLYDPHKPAEIALLKSKSWTAIQRVYDASRKFSWLDRTSFEEAEKNS